MDWMAFEQMDDNVCVEGRYRHHTQEEKFGIIRATTISQQAQQLLDVPL